MRGLKRVKRAGGGDNRGRGEQGGEGSSRGREQKQVKEVDFV